MSEKFRVVVVGCGGIAGAWLGSKATQELTEIVGLVDINEAAARKRAEEFGLQEVMIGTDFEAMLTATKPDIVFNLTIPDAHYETTLTAFRHGCHVLCEKPLADTLEHAQAMVQAAANAGKVFAVIQNRRFDPNIRRLRAFIDSGAIGKITTVHCAFLLDCFFGEDNFRTHMPHVLIHDMAIHTFDAARFITRATPKNAYCLEWNPSDSRYDRDVSASAIFQLSDGIVYTYQGSWCPKGLNTPWEAEWRIIGERGSVYWSGSTFRAEALNAEGRIVEMPVPEVEMDIEGTFHDGNIRAYLTCLRDSRTPETLASDNINSLAMVLAAVESSETGQKVEINI